MTSCRFCLYKATPVWIWWWWWWLMALMMNTSEVTLHLHFAWSLPVHGIAMATGDSSLLWVSTVTDLLSFISVARATQPWLIDGISALPQQRGSEVGLLMIDFQPLQTASPPLPPTHICKPAHMHTHTHTLSLTTPSHTHVILNYPFTPFYNSSFCADPVFGAKISMRTQA